MQRIAGTLIALLFLVWGLFTIVGGVEAARGDWLVLGGGIALFGCVFLRAVRYLWQGVTPRED